MTSPIRIESWWRCVTDSKGNVVERRIVEVAGTDGGGVFFVRASSEREADEAGRAAFNRYARERLQERRARYRAENRCACGRKRDVPGCNTCSACQAGVKQLRERREIKAAGKPVPRLDVGESLRLRRQAEDAEIRRDALRDVLRRFCEMPKADFKRWLEGEIRRLSGKRVA